MTVSNTTSYVQYTGPQTSPVTLPFEVIQPADLVVYLQSAAGATPVKLALNLDYTVPTGQLNQLSGSQLAFVSTGAIGTSLASGAILSIARDPAQVQAMFLAAQGPLAGPQVMAGLDLLTMEVQATRRIANNGVQIPVSESGAGLNTVLPPAAQRANKIIGFDGVGNVQMQGAGGGAGQFQIPNPITCWGDSLTLGVVGNGPSYPAQLSPLASAQCDNEGIGGQTSAQILTRVQAATAAQLAATTVIWAGRNDIGVNLNSVILANIASMVAKLNTPQFLVLSVVNGEGEGIGTMNYTQVTTLNAALAAAYPNNYYDIRSYLVAQYNPSIPGDVTDHTNDIPPGSLRWDAIHYLGTGYAFVAAQVNAFLLAKGWVPT